MTIIGARDIEEATGPVIVGPGDVITPLARDRAGELGVEVRYAAPGPDDQQSRPGRSHHRPAAALGRTAVAQGPPPPPAAGRADTVNGLYRRGAPVPDELSPSPPGGTARAAVIGAGHVGSLAALHLAASDLFSSVTLVDVVEGLAAGVALDLWHSAALAGFAGEVRGSTSLADLAGCDYVVVTAGRARKPGMTRTDLTEANAEIVGPVADQIRRSAPDAVVVVVTNPLEEMTHLTEIRTGFPPERVLGMAGVLDSARFAALVALTGVGRPDEVVAYALGSHGAEMVIPISLATVRGRPLRDVLDSATITAITERARDSGAEIVSLLKSGSAYFAPGRAAAEMVCEMVTGRASLLVCAVAPRGEYGLTYTRVGLPVRLGPGGLSEIVTLPLEPDELDQLRGAARSLSERIHAVS